MPANQDKLANLRRQLDKPAASESNPQGQGMTIHKAALVSVRVGDLKAAVEAQPDHPVAKAVARGIRGFSDEHELHIEKADLQGLLDNKEVVVNREVETDDFGTEAEVRVKSLGGETKSANVEAAPPSPATGDKASSPPVQPEKKNAPTGGTQT